MTFKTWAKDAAERIGSTLLQVFLPILLAAFQSDQSDIGMIALAALFPALGTAILAVLSVAMPPIKNYALDVTFRLARTIAAVFAGAWASDEFDVLDYTGWRAIFVAAGTAAFVFLKAELAKRKAGTITPASLASPAQS